MLSLFVSLVLLLAPLGNGHHLGWRNKKAPRTTPALEQAPTPTGGGSGASTADADGPVGHRYTD